MHTTWNGVDARGVSQVWYALNLRELLTQWSLSALQDLGAAGHRLRFDAATQACIEDVMISRVDDVEHGKLVPLLLWARSVSFERLQAVLVPLCAKRASLPSLEQAFGEQQPLLSLMQSLRLEYQQMERELTKVSLHKQGRYK